MNLRGGGRLLGAVLLVVGSAACSEDVIVPSVSKAASAFTQSWTAQDVDGMVESFADEAAGEWTAKSLEKWIGRTLDEGAITSLVVEVGKAEQPEVESSEELPGTTTTVPYTITYESDASVDPVEMSGRLPLVIEDGGWKVRWVEDLMWPENQEAAGFGVDIKEAKRGAIVDRNGEVLAKGQGADRRYPNGSVGGSTIGHIAPLPKKEVPPGLDPDELVGVAGLEKGLEDLLTASSGADLLLVDEAGKTTEVLGSKQAGKPEDVQVTLDIEMQRAAENAFGGTTGGAVVIEPSTGDLLAVVSSAPFDPNNYVGVEGVTPFNRALSGTYPPGSSMKVVTASAAIEEGLVKPTTEVTGPSNYMGVHNFESGEYGSISFLLATQKSVNTAFAQVAEDLGAKTMTEYAEKFGFNKEPAMPLGTATSSYPRPEDLTDLMWSAIGQAQVLATPLQMATIAAAVANDGTRMEPRILMDDPEEGVEVMSPKSAATMTELMEAVVVGGTGTAANLGTPTVAGKTGTAEVSVGGGIQNHAWFICFAPSDDPEVAVAVVSEFGGIGGEVAAPLARQILQAVLPLT